MRCEACDWTGEIRDGVEVVLSRKDAVNRVVQDYYDNYSQVAAHDLSNGILEERYVENQVENLLDNLPAVAGLEVCDLGCGQGRLSKRLLESGAAAVTCIDISMAYLSRLASVSGLRPVLANAERLPFSDAFEIIVSTDVMEHVLNVGSFLYCLNRALKMGGRACVRVPYKESLLPYSPYLGCQYDFVHLRSFDEKILRVYFEAAGFVIERVRLDGFVLGTPQPFWSRSEDRKRNYEKFKDWANEHCAHPANVTRWPSIFARLFMKPQEIVVVARKQKCINS